MGTNRMKCILTIFTILLALTGVYATVDGWASLSSCICIGEETGAECTKACDNNTATEWADYGHDVDLWIYGDCGINTCNITQLRYYHDHGREPDGAYWKEIYVSNSTASWGSDLLASDTCMDIESDAWVTVDITDAVGRYVKVVFDSSEGVLCADAPSTELDYFYEFQIYNGSAIVTADSTPPTITVVIPVNNTNYTWASGGNELNITFGETVNWGAYNIDNSGNTSTGAVAEHNTTIKVAAGEHNLTIYCNDSSGNANSTFVEFNVSSLVLTVTNYQNGTANSSYTYYRGDVFNLTAVCSSIGKEANITTNITGNIQNSNGTGSVEVLGSWNNSVYPAYNYIMNGTCYGDENHTDSSSNISTLVLDPGIDFYVNSTIGTYLYWSFTATSFEMNEPINQSSTVPSLCINNTNKTGAEQNYNFSIILATNTSELYNITVWANYDYNSTNATEVTNQTDFWIFNTTGANDPKCFWIWANNTPGMTAKRGIWTPTIYADTKVSTGG